MPPLSRPDAGGIWLAPFRPASGEDLPFEIVRTEALPPIALGSQPVRHAFHVLHWIERGAGSYAVDFEHHEVRPGTLFWLAAGQVHAWFLEAPVAGSTLLFTDEFLTHAPQGAEGSGRLASAHRLHRSPALTPDAASSERIERRIAELADEYGGDRSDRAGALQALLRLLLIEVDRAYAAGAGAAATDAPLPLADRFLDLVEERFGALHRVADYARLLHVTPGHLSERVKDRTGATAATHIRRRRTLEAKRLLLHADLSVEGIAYALGFADPAYFGRFFRREVGVAPGTFRREIREKYQKLHSRHLE